MGAGQREELHHLHRRAGVADRALAGERRVLRPGRRGCGREGGEAAGRGPARRVRRETGIGTSAVGVNPAKTTQVGQARGRRRPEAFLRRAAGNRAPSIPSKAICAQDFKSNQRERESNCRLGRIDPHGRGRQDDAGFSGNSSVAAGLRRSNTTGLPIAAPAVRFAVTGAMAADKSAPRNPSGPLSKWNSLLGRQHSPRSLRRISPE